MANATVRAKFRCESLTDFGMTKEVRLSAVCNDADPDSENSSFNRYTPSGELRMSIDNDAASIQFVPGKEYYLDFSEAPAEA